MCLILFAVNPSPEHRLIVAANRDELYARPTEAAAFWASDPNILAGRDIDAGGTWLGVNRAGCFAAVTNFKQSADDPEPSIDPPRSRGELPLDFLRDRPAASRYVTEVAGQATEYRGFNLIASDTNSTYYFGNRGRGPRELKQGFYGLSNQLLDCDWPKVIEGKLKLKEIVSEQRQDLPQALFELLLDTGDDRMFSNSFIEADIYGTRAATVVMVSTAGEVYFEERNFGPAGKPEASNHYAFKRIDDF